MTLTSWDIISSLVIVAIMIGLIMTIRHLRKKLAKMDEVGSNTYSDTTRDDLKTDSSPIPESELIIDSRRRLLTEYMYNDGPARALKELKHERYRIRLTRNGWTAFEYVPSINLDFESEQYSELRNWTYGKFSYINDDEWRKTADKIPYRYIIYWDWRAAPYSLDKDTLIVYMKTQMGVTEADYRVEDDSFPKYVTNLPPHVAAEIYACRNDYD